MADDRRLRARTPFGYADWLAIAAWYALGNMLGGIALVTGLRMVQLGRRIRDEQNTPRERTDSSSGDDTSG